MSFKTLVIATWHLQNRPEMNLSSMLDVGSLKPQLLV
jgi:hypothetical protein